MGKFILTIFFCLFIITGFAQESSNGKISGLMFGDYFYNVIRDSLIEDVPNKALLGIKDLNGFQFRRIYFTYDYKISDKFSTRFRLESQTVVGVANTLFAVYIKDAYLKWKDIFVGSNLILGIQPPPTFTVSESFWKYRSLEKTIMDLRRIASARDFGIALMGNLISNGKVNYCLMYGNGAVFENEADKFKRVYAHLDFIPSENLRVTVYGDYRFNPEKNYSSYQQSFNNDALVTSVFLGYQEISFLSLGLETFLQMNNNDVSNTNINAVEDRNAIGISLFGSYSFSDNLAGVLRYDYFDPNMSGDFNGDSRNFFSAGLDFKVHEMVSIIPNIELETYETPSNGVSIDPSLTARITFYYEFL
jgi:hypothetical protein